jgi:glycine cleavage system regulatory protein
MHTRLVLTVIGPDRPGLVDALSGVIAGVGGSWQESRLARLAGHFAGIVEVIVVAARTDELTRALEGLKDLAVRVTPTQQEASTTTRRVARLAFVGHDRPGLVQAISHVLARAGANVDELETHSFPSPMSGVPIFEAAAEMHLPDELELARLREELETVARDLMVDIELVEEV